MSATTALRPANTPPAAFIEIGWINTVLAVIATLLCVRTFSAPVMHPLLQASYGQDDLFYYLKVAQNIAAGRGSTFDGTTLTNGYHPLYMLLLVSISHFGTSLTHVFKCLWCLDVVSAMAVFLMTRRLLQRRGVIPLLANGIAMIFLFYVCRLLFQQMEVTLTLPLGLALLTVADAEPELYTGGRMLLLGALTALTFLSRLDSVLFLSLFFGILLFQQRLRQCLSPRKILCFTLTSVVPVAGYLFVNLHVFHRFTPISGVAKDLKFSWLPSTTALFSFNGINGPLLLISSCFLVWFFVSVRSNVSRYARLTIFEKAAIPACLIFPVVHLIVLSILSDWKLWGWYSYSLRFAYIGVLLLAVRSVSPAWLTPGRAVAWSSCAAGLLLLTLARYKVDVEMVAIAQAAGELVDFQKTHPGKYAMGDRAGMFGFESPYPVLQTEGLMMDSAYLNQLRRQEPLRSALRGYGVDYYVTYILQPHTGCLEVEEPAQAGPMAPHMRALFCEPPLATFTHSTGITVVYSLHDSTPALPEESPTIQSARLEHPWHE